MKYTLMQLIVAITFLCCFHSFAQDYELEKVSKEELELATYRADSSASAVILDRSRNTYFDYSASQGWVVITDMHERIKILSKEGLDYATNRLKAYKNHKDRIKINELEGFTYTLENGEVKKYPLQDEGVFEYSESDDYDFYTWTMPNVKVGDIIEWKYTIYAPFISSLVPLKLQQDIPVKHYYAKISTPQFFLYKKVKRGLYDIDFKEHIGERSLKINDAINLDFKHKKQSENLGTLYFKELISQFEANNVPALTHEKYVNNIDDYKLQVLYELESSTSLKGKETVYSKTWQDVTKMIFEDEEFGKQLQSVRYLENDAKQLISQEGDTLNRLKKAFEFVKHRITWNGKRSYWAKKDLEESYTSRTGNVAGVNLNLIAFLNACGFDAHPVLLSTRQHGITNFPSLRAYDYVIALVKLNGKTFLLDATEPMSALNVLPARAYSGQGRMIKPDGTSTEINLYNNHSGQNYLLRGELTADGVLTGSISHKYTGLEALEARKSIEGQSLENYTNAIVPQELLDYTHNFKIENKEDSEEFLLETYDFEIPQAVSVVGDKMYMAPLLFLKLGENPYNRETRSYPVDQETFVHAISVNLKLPEGYTVETAPEAVKMALPNGLGTYFFTTTSSGNLLNVMVRFTLNKPQFPAEDYAVIKDFYNQRLIKENEKVVLVKT